MYISRIPLRVSLLGGGSDLPEFYENGNNGEVIGFCIKKYISIYANLPLLIENSLIKYSETETFNDPSTLTHPLFREALKKYWTKKQKIELASFSDIRSGTGLGSSSIFTVALVAILRKINNQTFTPYSLTKDGFNIERYDLQLPVGLQDGAYGAYGGCSHFRFFTGDELEHSSINLYSENVKRIKECFFLVFTDQSRNAKNILKKHTSNLRDVSKKRDTQLEIVSYVKEGKKALQSGNFEKLGSLLYKSYNLKKSLNEDEFDSSSIIYKVEKLLNHKSIFGFKLLGAGGGGFFLVIGDGKNCKNYLEGVNLKPIPIEIENKGCSIIDITSLER